jgi:hypothetical protein
LPEREISSATGRPVRGKTGQKPAHRRANRRRRNPQRGNSSCHPPVADTRQRCGGPRGGRRSSGPSGHKQSVAAVCTLDARCFANACAPLVGAHGRVATLAGFVFPAHGVDIRAAPKQSAEQRDFSSVDSGEALTGVATGSRAMQYHWPPANRPTERSRHAVGRVRRPCPRSSRP